MTKSNLFVITYIASVFSFFSGTILKIMHIAGGELFLISAFVFTIIYAVTALSEIYGSDRLTTQEKAIWLTGFILFSTITGLIYFYSGRPRIKRNYKILYQDKQK